MNAQQRRIYLGNMRHGALFTVAGPTWAYYPPPTADGMTTTPTLTQDGTRTLYIAQEKLGQWGQPIPPQPVGAYVWRLIAPIGTDIAAGAVVASGAYAFSIGPLDTYQGFPSAIVQVFSGSLTSTSTGQAGYRSPLWILGIAAA